MTHNRIKINDIAQLTGLSTTTVSRVLNGKAKQYRIGKESQEKIKKIAKELNYIPNQNAANLRTGRSNTIALIVPSLNNPFFANIASNINNEVRDKGYVTIVGDSDEDVATEKLILQQLSSRNIEGIIIVPCGNKWAHIKELHDQGLPIVCIDRYFDNLDIPFVSTDNHHGAYLATRHLIEQGHTIIACIQGVKESTPNKLRIKGYLDALSESGIKDILITGDEFSFHCGYIETKLLLQQKNKPTAIFTLSNTIAMGAMKALKEERIKIPDDISLITFDDHPYLDYLATPLSCVAQPVTDISKIATKFLFSEINRNKMPLPKILLKPNLNIKESVKRLNSRY
ncbi:LacI family DNA-binding transcriptional regulator [Sunxiuqinia indica]|uniref:LacI family DNA-binding transcriptional regulator n=1 Tax=Sunxiuqinia indica TaxID=2692584 RepID=UPI00135B23A4|nr:LacI family DNA-binding transcriptional regulator [Sunxiuqinia indica]